MKHTYKINGIQCIFDPEAKIHGDRYKDETGRRFTGVTSALSAISKPALIDWAAKEAYLDIEAFLKKPEWISNVTNLQKYIKSVFKEKDYAHKRKSKDATDIGGSVHEAFENWVTEHPLVRPVAEFFEREGIKILAHEYPVFHPKYWYAGTFDALVEWNGKRYIVDWKTSSGVYGRDYFAQCAAYLEGFKVTYPDKEAPVGYLVIRVDKKTGKFDSRINKTDAKGNLSTYGNVFFVGNPRQLESDFKYFLMCLGVYRNGLVDYYEEVEPLINQYAKV